MSWIGAELALELLGTKPQTLYANVSRGRIGARPDPNDPRRSQYRREDVERLAARQRGRRPATQVAKEAMSWGEPVLATALSTIEQGQLFFRGRNAVEFAREANLEDAAQLLWNAEVEIAQAEVAGPPGLATAYRAIAELAVQQMPALGRSHAVLVEDAAVVLGTMASSIARTGPSQVHQRLAASWQKPEAAEILRQALVLLAEHELNASTFAARIAASTGAPLAAAVMAGLAALSGPLHGNASLSMRSLVQDAERIGAEAAVGATLRLGQPLPCFGHKLYDGDVRATALLAAFDMPEVYRDLAREGERLSGEKPNVDFALAAITAAFSLPKDAPLQLFALGRSVGWLAHALEQIETGALIRPRARYVGVAIPPPSLPPKGEE